MAINIGDQTNIDKSDLANYPNGQILDNTGGPGTGTPIIRITASDMWMLPDKLMRLAQIPYSGNFDNESNGYQFVNALIALASKSDYIQALGTTADILQLPNINLDILNLDEKLICQAATNWTVETQIKGSTATLLTVTITRQYKAGDYLMMRRTSGGVTLVCIITYDNLNVVVNELSYLKAAANSDEDTGTSVAKATTPASNKYIFTKRVTDPTAAIPFLVSTTTPGLMSAADKVALNSFSSPVKNVGFFSGVDVGGGTVGAFYTPGGDITQAQITAIIPNTGGNLPGGGSQILVTMAHAMANTNYFVRMFLQSQGTLSRDTACAAPVFIPLTTTTFTLAIGDVLGGVQNLKIHCEVVQL